MNRRDFLVAATLGAVVAMTVPGVAGTLKDVKSAGVLQIATTGSNAPYTFVGPQNALQGFDIDWSKAICKKLGVKAEFVKLDWRGILPGLNAGQFDAAMSAVRITEERAKQFTFSAPYAHDASILVVRADNTDIKSIKDLDGKTVGTATGSSQQKIAKREAPGATQSSYAGLPDLLMDLNAGRIDAVVAGYGGAAYAIKTMKSPLKLVGKPLDPSPLGMVFAKQDTKLAEAVSTAIKSLEADGTADKISAKWFGHKSQ